MKRSITQDFCKWSSKAGRKPLLIYGARQIGKTYSILDFAETNFENYLYVNFEKMPAAKADFEESLEPKKILEKLSLRFNKAINPQKDLLIFDEVQDCPKAITSLKYFCEDLPSMRLIAAGSLLGVKLGQGSYPVGKVETLYMRPMSFEEFLEANDNLMLTEHFQNIPSLKTAYAHEKFWELLKHYFIVGGMPAAVDSFFATKDDQLINRINAAITVQERILEIYFADIGKHSGKENAMQIIRILENIPEQLAREADANSSRYRFKGVIANKNKYSQLVSSIDWLQAAGLIHRVQILHHIAQPLSAYHKESFFKLYLFDIGMLRALYRLDPRVILDYDFGSYKGYYAENFVLQELVYASKGWEKFYSWTEHTAEIEFVINIDGSIVPIEVKSGSRTQSKSLHSYTNKYQPKHKIILSAQELKLNTEEGFYKIPLYLAAKLEGLLN